jgi:hypothetical protein
MNRLYQLAIVCGALPLLTGISIFVLWVITKKPWLTEAGLYTLSGGAALLLIGAVALACFCWNAFRKPNTPSRRLWLATLACAGLLLSNFPVAGGIILAVLHLESRYVVVVHNASPLPLTKVRVVGGGCERDFGTIRPGRQAQRTHWIKQDGHLKFHAVQGPKTHDQLIDEYITPGLGGRTTVTANPDNTLSVSNGSTLSLDHNKPTHPEDNTTPGSENRKGGTP